MGNIITTNNLTDFDLCLALAQSAINSQMGYAWNAWKRRCGFTDKIRIFKEEEGDQLVDVDYGIEATVAPLEIDLNVDNAKLAQARVTLRLTEGTIKYFNMRKKRDEEYPIVNWSLSFLTDLEKQPVDLEILKKIDPSSYESAVNTIEGTGLNSSVFSIEYLFLKLSQVDLMLESNKNLVIPDDVPGAAKELAKSNLNYLLQGRLVEGEEGRGKFLLGTVVARKRKEGIPTFALTDFIFDTHPNPEAPSASTLNYLGKLANGVMPADTIAARLKMRDAWVRPEQLDGRISNISGIMAINETILVERYLIPFFSKALGREPRREGLAWTYSFSKTIPNEIKSLIKMVYQTTKGYELTLSIQPRTNKILLSGKAYSSFHYDGMTWLATDISNHTEWNYVEGYQPIIGEITTTCKGTGAQFRVDFDLDFKFGDPQVTRNEIGGFSNVIDAFAQAFKAIGLVGNTPQEGIRNFQKAMENEIRNYLGDAINQIDVNLSQQAFIPPGGGVFEFQNPCWSNAGDLFFDVIYKAP